MKFGERLENVKQLNDFGWKYLSYEDLKVKMSKVVENFHSKSDEEFRTWIKSETYEIDKTFFEVEEKLIERYEKEIFTFVKKDKELTDGKVIVDFINFLQQIREYVGWNYMAVLKIVKKYNKNTKSKPEHHDIDAVDILMQTHFYRSPLIADLITKSEVLLSSFPSLLQRENLQCCICLDRLNHPVVLPCTHRFCWECLDLASKIQRSCPVCRKVDPYSLDPANFVVNSSVATLVARRSTGPLMASPDQTIQGRNENYHEGEDDSDNEEQRSHSQPINQITVSHSPAQKYGCVDIIPPTKGVPASTVQDVHLGSLVIEVLVNSQTTSCPGWESAIPCLALSDLPEVFSYTDPAVNITTTRVTKKCPFDPLTLFVHLQQLASLSPFFFNDINFMKTAPVKQPMNLPNELKFDSHVTMGCKAQIKNYEVLAVQSSLVSHSLIGLILFEYKCRSSTYDGPWLVIGALIQPNKEDPNQSELVVGVQLDKNLCPDENPEMHACNLVERTVQQIFVKSLQKRSSIPVTQTIQMENSTLTNNLPVQFPVSQQSQIHNKFQKRFTEDSNNARSFKRQRICPEPLTNISHSPSSSILTSLTNFRPVGCEQQVTERVAHFSNLQTEPKIFVNNSQNSFPSTNSILPPIPTEPIVQINSKRDFAQKFDRFGRIIWTEPLHDLFLQSIQRLGIFTARPKSILQMMNVEDLTVEHIKSHLQMYRNSVKQASKLKNADKVSLQLVRGIKNDQFTYYLKGKSNSNEDELIKFIEEFLMNEKPSHLNESSKQIIHNLNNHQSSNNNNELLNSNQAMTIHQQGNFIASQSNNVNHTTFSHDSKSSNIFACPLITNAQQQQQQQQQQQLAVAPFQPITECQLSIPENYLSNSTQHVQWLLHNPTLSSEQQDQEQQQQQQQQSQHQDMNHISQSRESHMNQDIESNNQHLLSSSSIHCHHHHNNNNTNSFHSLESLSTGEISPSGSIFLMSPTFMGSKSMNNEFMDPAMSPLCFNDSGSF